MSRMLRHTFSTIAVLAALQGLACQDVAAPVDPVEPVERIQRIEASISPTFVIVGEAAEDPSLAERMAELGVPGVSIAVLNDGHIAWARGYGMADVETGRAVTPETLFQAASISKPVAALAALRLVQNQTLDLDANVNVGLESWTLPDNEFTTGESVTLRRLLNHTAGTTVWGFPGYASKTNVQSTVGVLDGNGNTDPIRVFKTPGESWRYSGGGYTVMQQLVMDATRTSFPQLMWETVLEPVGMTLSTYEQPLPEARWTDAATGYRSDGTPTEQSWHTYPEMAAAGLWTTPSDLARYAIAVQRAFAGEPDAILSRALTAEMLTAGMNDWGLGPVVEGDGTRFGHGGANDGFRASFTAFIEEGQGAFVMTNSDTGGGLAQEIILTIAKEYGWPGPKPAERVAVTLDPDALQRVVGSYEVAEPNVQVSVTVRDGKLMVAVADQEEDELVPESRTRFFLRSNGQPVEVELENDRPVALVVGSTRAERIQ